MWRNKRRAVAPAGTTGTKMDTQQRNGDDRRCEISSILRTIPVQLRPVKIPWIKIRRNSISDLPLRNALAHLYHLTRHIAPHNRLLFRRQRVQTVSYGKVSEVQGRGVDADKDFVGFWRRDWCGVFSYAGGAGGGGKAV